VCDKYQIVDKIQLNTEVSEVRWLEEEEVWEATLVHMAPGTGDLSTKERRQMMAEKGRESVYLKEEIIRAKIVCSAAGGLVEPNAWPDTIPGRDQFEGAIFHSARWDSSVDLKDKDVIVVGTGCSAAQFVPELTKAPYNVKSVTQVMRSPPWALPRFEPLLGYISLDAWEKWSPVIFSKLPFVGRAYRAFLFCLTELDFQLIFKGTNIAHKTRKAQEAALVRHMKSIVPEKYHEILTPDYSVGCKRRIFDAFWLKSLNDPKIDLTTQPLTSLQPKGVTLGPGRTYPNPEDTTSKAPTEERHLPADVIVLANGFELTTWLSPLKVRGKNNAIMQEVWDARGGPQAYMGNAVDGFPNFFIIFGPNTATGHSSVILASENMVEYSLKFIKKILDHDVKTFDVKKEKEIEWTKMIQEKLKDTVWHTGGCHSWYKTANGWNATAYP
jgi:cation diffusion facilitator CzcD-associated flavoprotein CzcO